MQQTRVTLLLWFVSAEWSDAMVGVSRLAHPNCGNETNDRLPLTHEVLVEVWGELCCKLHVIHEVITCEARAALKLPLNRVMF